MDISNKRNYLQTSFDLDIKKFQKELDDQENNVENRIRNIIQKSTKFIKDCVFTRKIKINFDTKLKDSQSNYKNILRKYYLFQTKFLNFFII